MKLNSSVIVSISADSNDLENAIVLVGKKVDTRNVFKEVEVINAFKGEEAMNIWNKLLGDKIEKDN